MPAASTSTTACPRPATGSGHCARPRTPTSVSTAALLRGPPPCPGPATGSGHCAGRGTPSSVSTAALIGGPASAPEQVGGQHAARVEDPVRVQGELDAPHDLELLRTARQVQVGALGHADAVLGA